MGSRRTVILIGAVLFGLLATIGLFSWVRGVEDSVAEGAEAIDVLVAKQAIPQGMSADEALKNGMIEVDQIQSDFSPAAALNEISQVQEGFASTNIPAGQVIVADAFLDERKANNVNRIVNKLENEDLVTVTLELDKHQNVASLVEPGDFVNVLSITTPRLPFWGTKEEPATADLSQEAYNEFVAVTAANRLHSHIPESLRTTLGLGEDEEPKKFPELTKEEKTRVIAWATTNESFFISNQLSQRNSRYLYQKALVVAVDQKINPSTGGETDGGVGPTTLLVTLGVAPRDVQVILNASRQNNDGIYLSLVPDDYEPTPLPNLDPSLHITPGEDEYRLIPTADGRILDDVDGRSIPTDAKQAGGSASVEPSEEATPETEPDPPPTPAADGAPADGEGSPGDLAFQSPPLEEAN